MDAAGTAMIDDQELAQRLRAAGLKATRARLLVLEVLQETGPHLSTDELVEALDARGTPLPRGSVYNVVGALATHGLMMVTDIGPGRALYELAERWHHHFVCRTCGRIEDVECVVGQSPCLDPGQVDGEVDEAQVIFRGICTKCRD